MARYRDSRGFTLLELLVAISVFAVLSLMGYGALSSAIREHRQGEQDAYQLKGLQMGLLFLERDLQQVVDRPIDVGANTEPAFEYVPLDARLRLTRTGWSNPLRQARGDLQRVEYRFDKGKLYRDSWFHLDRLGSDESPDEAVLLEGLSDWNIRFMDDKGQWQTTWPPRDAQGKTTQDLPSAVEFSFKKKGWGKIRRLIRLPGS